VTTRGGGKSRQRIGRKGENTPGPPRGPKKGKEKKPADRGKNGSSRGRRSRGVRTAAELPDMKVRPIPTLRRKKGGEVKGKDNPGIEIRSANI